MTFVYEPERTSEGNLQSGLEHASKIVAQGNLDPKMTQAVQAFAQEVLPRAKQIVVTDVGSKSFFNAGFVYQPDRGRPSDRHSLEVTLPDDSRVFLIVGKVTDPNAFMEMTHATMGALDSRRTHTTIYDFGNAQPNGVVVTTEGRQEALPESQRPSSEQIHAYLRDINGFGSPIHTFTYK